MNDIEKMPWWSISQEKIIELLNVNIQQGLSVDQVKEHRSEYGKNTLFEAKPTSIMTLISEGIREPMILLLSAIAVLSLLFGKFGEAITMIFVIVAYILVELINKFRTDRIMVKLKKLTTLTAKVIRNGAVVEVPISDIVVGDILILSEGAFVPADARLISSYNLIVNEASLTGESFPIEKKAIAKVADNAPLAERINAIFSGTTILHGEGTAIIVAVGDKSEFGKIAKQVQETTKEKTILQESMTKLAKVLALFALVASALIPTLGYLRGLGFQEMVLTWLSLTFLMIPGQPPIIITMALALAAFALAQKQVIVKRLHGVEIIGQVTSVISDKTGTITQSTMELDTFFTTIGETKTIPRDIQEKIILALPRYHDNPTDKAVFKALDKKEKNIPQIGFYGFSDKRPWRDLVYKKNENFLHAIAGSPEILIDHSDLSSDRKKEIQEFARQQASLGKRVTAYVYSENNTQKLDHLKNLTFVALAVLKDPIRSGVKEAIVLLEQATINTFIVTGDHKATAQAIGQEIGITGEVHTGDQLAIMNDSELISILKHPTIFARMDPSQKLRLVKLLQQEQEIVAVIGDGVNDAPALKAAQVGIAMGQIGTDLAKEVSDLILTDDNYIHVPDAVAIGRRALNNFEKGLTYYLAAKSILLIIFLTPLLLGIPFPFAPIQIILIELLMDLASSTIFVTEEAEPGIMERPAQKIKNFLSKQLILKILRYGLPLAIGITVIYLYAFHFYNITIAQTAAFVAWLIGHIFLALNLKQTKKPLIIQGILSNYFGFFWLCGMVILSLVITYVPLLHPYLKTTWLPISLWIFIIIIICVSTFWIELIKIIRFKKK